MSLRNKIRDSVTWKRGLAAVAASAGLVLLGHGPVGAQLADRGDRTIAGRIQDFTTAPRGEIDGATLDDGTLLHWPPHTGERMSEMLKKGDRVEAQGMPETTPKGDTHFEVRSITNLRTDASLDVASLPPPNGPRRDPRPRPGRELGESRTVRGAIDRFTTAPRGEVDGAVLGDGTVIHWPPHLQDRFTNGLRKGDEVKVVGQMETTPRGDTHLEVASVTNERTDASIVNDDRPPRGPRRGPAAGREDRDRQLRDLQEQLERIQREIDRLKNDR
jgi:hypothetical protein